MADNKQDDYSPVPELAAAIKAAEEKYKDLPPGLLEGIAGIESKGGRNLVNPKSSARGPFQFMEQWGPEYGLHSEADRMDFAKATDAAARKAVANKKMMEKRLGREVTPGEQYLAWQQGATGALRLLANPTKPAAEVVGDRDFIKLNGGDPDRDTAHVFATKWTDKLDEYPGRWNNNTPGARAPKPVRPEPPAASLTKTSPPARATAELQPNGGGQPAPAKKPEGAQRNALGATLGDLTVPSTGSFYNYDPSSLAALERESLALTRMPNATPPPKRPDVDPSLLTVPKQTISSTRDLMRPRVEDTAAEMQSPGDTPRDRQNTAILQGMNTFQKANERLSPVLGQVTGLDDTQTAPSGLPGEFAAGVTSGMMTANADMQYFGAIIETLGGNEKGAKARLYNAQQYEEDASRAMAGMQTFEEFLKEPTFGGFISQVVSATGQVAPSALESMASALVTGGLATIAKAGLSVGAKVVAKTLIKDMIKKKAKGEALDAAEEGVLNGLYNGLKKSTFAKGAVVGGFTQEYTTMSGEAFAEYKDAGVDLDADAALKSLLIGVPQAAIGVGGEAAILGTLGKLALKKSTRLASDSVLKRFAADVARTTVKSGALEGISEAGQESVSVWQRASVDPTFTAEDGMLRIGQAAFAGFFGGGVFAGGASLPAAGSAAINRKTIQDKAKNLLKAASEGRVETEVDNDTKGVDDGALTGTTTPESPYALDAQVDLMLSGHPDKRAVWVTGAQNVPEDIAPPPGKVKEYTYGPEAGKHAGKTVLAANIPGRGTLISADPAIIDDVMSTYEIGGDVDEAIGRAITYVGGKDGDTVVRVKDVDGNVVDEQIASDANIEKAQARAGRIADSVPGATVDLPDVGTALEDRAQNHLGDRKDFLAEAAALKAITEQLGSVDITEEEAAKNGHVKDVLAAEPAPAEEPVIKSDTRAVKIRPGAKSSKVAVKSRNQDVDVLINPSRDQIAQLAYVPQAERGTYGNGGRPWAPLRLSYDVNGDAYIWRARDAIHHDVTNELSKRLGVSFKHPLGKERSGDALNSGDGFIRVINGKPELYNPDDMGDVQTEPDDELINEDTNTPVAEMTDKDVIDSIASYKESLTQERKAKNPDEQVIKNIERSISRFEDELVKRGHTIEKEELKKKHNRFADVKGKGTILDKGSSKPGVLAPNGRIADALYKPEQGQTIVYGKDGRQYKPRGISYTADGGVTAYFEDHRGKEGDYAVGDDEFYTFSRPIDTRLFDGRETKNLSNTELQDAYSKGLRAERTGDQGAMDRQAAYLELTRRGIQPTDYAITELDAENHFIEVTKADVDLMLKALDETSIARISQNLLRQDIFRFGREGEARMDELSKVLTRLSMYAEWPTTTDSKDGTSLDIAVKLAEMHARLLPQRVLRDGMSIGLAVERLKEIAGKYTPAEKKFVWEFIRRLALLNGGVMPVIEETDLATLRNMVSGGLASYSPSSNSIAMTAPDPVVGQQLPGAFIIAHELSHWAFANVLSSDQIAEFMKIVRDLSPRRKQFISAFKDADTVGNEGQDPQEFFANQFASWAMQEFGLTSEQVLETKSEAYAGQTFSKQVRMFFSKVASQILGYLRHIFDPKSVAPELKDFFERVLPPLNELRANNIEIDPKTGITSASGSPLSKLAYDFYIAMGAPEDGMGEWGPEDKAAQIKLVDDAVADPSISEEDMKSAFRDVYDDWREDMTGWSKEKIADAWKDWGNLDEYTSKAMELDDEGEPVNDAADSQADTTAIDEQLNSSYAELDRKNATRIEQFPIRDEKETLTPAAKAKIDKLWIQLTQLVPDRDQYASYEKLKDQMPVRMLEKLIQLNKINNDNVELAYYDVALDKAVGSRKEDVLSITQRDPFPDSETTVTREAVRDALRQVARFPGDLADVTKRTKRIQRENSSFWLVNRYTGEKLRLNGTPRTKRSDGRTGLHILAQVGVNLNTRLKRNLQGEGLTAAQKYGQGLQTILGDLAIAGYDLHVGEMPTALQPAYRERAVGYTKKTTRSDYWLTTKAQKEPVLTINGKSVRFFDLIYGKRPFDSSKSDFDASQNTQQLSDTHELITPTETVRNRASSSESDGKGRNIAELDPGSVRTEERTRRSVESSGPEQFALQEDKTKKLNNVEDEYAHSALVLAKQNANIKSLVEFAEERGSVDILLDGLPDIPSDVVVTVTKSNRAPTKGKNAGKRLYKAVITSSRFSPKVVEHSDADWVLAKALAAAAMQPDFSPIQYNRLALDTRDATVRARDQHPEILGVPELKGQNSIKDEGTTTASTNKVTSTGNIGPLTSRILGMASSMFNFHRPLEVMTLSHLKNNFDELTSQGALYERARDMLQGLINTMDDPTKDSPGHVLMGNRYLVVLRDEPLMGLDDKGEKIIAPDDAKIGAVLAHEIGHIVFRQEQASLLDGTPLKKAMWDAYVKHRQTMLNDNGSIPLQYRTPKEAIAAEVARRKAAKEKRSSENEVIEDMQQDTFEEWYADQVMAHVYNQTRQVKNITDGYFKRVAKAFFKFFSRVNDALEGRLKLSRENISSIKRKDPKTGQVKYGGTFTEYMEQVIERHQKERELDNTLPVEAAMAMKQMVLNIQARLPAGAQRMMANANAQIMRSGSMKKLTHGLMNIVNASTDFMKLSEHGQGGKNLSNFFGTYSQSMEKLGWNKRELFMQNRWNNKLADIFGFNDQTNESEWDTPRTRAIMIEAMDENKTRAQLSTEEAKKIRDLYAEIEQTYLKRPGSNRYYIPEFRHRANYGGPRMWNVDKITANKAEFIAWLAPRIQGNPEAVWDQITRHNKDQLQAIFERVDTDITNAVVAGQPQATPAQRAAMAWRMSTDDSAVMEVRDKVLRDGRRGVYNIADVTAELLRHDPTNPRLTAIAAMQPADQFEALKKHWNRTTEQLRLTPGMDPALRRTLAPEVNTVDAYNADPNDPNGWLLPPSMAHAQYMHYIARRVEFERMGRERGAMSGADYIIEQLDSIPEEYRMGVDESIMANLGKFGENMSNKWRAVNSVAAVWTVFTTLLFTTLSSVTDLAGIIMRSKDVGALDTFIKGMKTTLTERDFQELARSVGVVTGRTQEHMMIGQGELDYANKTARKLMNGFFRYTGLEFYTKFTRSLAVGMGREFVINTALKQDFGVREERYLAELGLTRDDVRNWLDQYQMFDTPHGEKVRMAIARFADEAVIRPDASQRPTWASNPYLQMVWQLKSYYYGFGKTILGGMGREIKNRYSEDGNFNGAAATMMLYASTIIPLTMFGMASRDWLKYLFQLAIPGLPETASTSMKLDSMGYAFEILKRSGTLGPFALGVTTMEAFKFEGIAAPFTANVPMFDLFDDTIFDGDLTRPVPVINNIK